MTELIYLEMKGKVFVKNNLNHMIREAFSIFDQ